MDKEIVPQSLGYCLGSLISSGYSNSVFGEVVGYDQNVLCPSGSGFLGLGLTANTPFTGSDFPVNIRRHSWPVETCVDKVQHSVHSHMTK